VYDTIDGRQWQRREWPVSTPDGNDAATPFGQRGPLPPELRSPALVTAAVMASILAGVGVGLWRSDPAPMLVRVTFFAAAFGYLAVSIFDFAEHFRIERLATGRAFSSVVVPLGETINHLATTIVLVVLLWLARPPPPSLAPRDYVALAAPLAFWILGWRDELVYHRRRATHREDIMHTTAHLAAGVMLAAFVALRMIRW
jgi:hypothetical protein